MLFTGHVQLSMLPFCHLTKAIVLFVFEVTSTVVVIERRTRKRFFRRKLLVDRILFKETFVIAPESWL